MSSFGKRLSAGRNAKGWTQAEVAWRLGATPSVIGKEEREYVFSTLDAMLSDATARKAYAT